VDERGSSEGRADAAAAADTRTWCRSLEAGERAIRDEAAPRPPTSRAQLGHAEALAPAESHASRRGGLF
jgi:hypothetical protein